MDWFRDDFKVARVALVASLIGAAGTIISFIYFMMKRAEMSRQLDREEAALRQQEERWNKSQESLRNLELAQCESTHVMGNPQLSLRLRCPTKDLPPKGSMVQPQPAMNSHQQLLPNHGFFGPFGTVMNWGAGRPP